MDQVENKRSSSDNPDTSINGKDKNRKDGERSGKGDGRRKVKEGSVNDISGLTATCSSASCPAVSSEEGARSELYS